MQQTRAADGINRLDLLTLICRKQDMFTQIPMTKPNEQTNIPRRIPTEPYLVIQGM